MPTDPGRGRPGFSWAYLRRRCFLSSLLFCQIPARFQNNSESSPGGGLTHKIADWGWNHATSLTLDQLQLVGRANVSIYLDFAYQRDYQSSIHLSNSSLRYCNLFGSSRKDSNTTYSGGADIFDASNVQTSSTFQISHKDTSAQAAFWSSCHSCSMENGEVLLHDPAGTARAAAAAAGGGEEESGGGGGGGVLLGRSQHLSGVGSAGVDVRGRFADAPFDLGRCDIIVDKPVYLFTLAFQVGHLIVDGLEGLYNTMRGNGALPGFRNGSDVYLVMDAIGEDLRISLAKGLLEQTCSDTPFSMLRLFTEHPIYTFSALQNVPGRVCFGKGLYIGLNISHSYYAHGYDFHPSLANLDSYQDRLIAGNYKDFHGFLHQKLGLGDSNLHALHNQAPKQITYIQRTRNRFIENERELLLVIQNTMNLGSWEPDSGFEFNIAQLESMKFSDQVALLQKTSILVSQWGTGAHNVLFLPYGAALILMVHPGFCDWSWAYANQAFFSGIHTYILCDEPSPQNIYQYAWAKKGHVAFPWEVTPSNATICLTAFQRLLSESILVTKNHRIAQRPLDVKAVVRRLLYKPNPRQDSLLPRINCGDGYLPSEAAWVRLGPWAAAAAAGGGGGGGGGAAEFSVGLRVASALPPAALARRRPALALCARLLLGPAPAPAEDDKEFCLTDPTSGTKSTKLQFKGSYSSPHFVSAWLRDLDTGIDLPASMTFLPIQTNLSYEALAQSTNRDNNELISLQLPIRPGIMTVADVLVGEEGLFQRSLDCFCRINDLDLKACFEAVSSAFDQITSAM